MHGVLGGVVIVGGSLLLTLLAVVVVRRLISHQTLARHNDVAGFVYATTGVTYAESVVEVAWPAMEHGEDPTQETAAALDELYAVCAQPAFVAAVNPEQYGATLE